MASLLRVAELNNSGASMLVAAKDKDAFKTLQTALSIMESEMLVASDKSDSSESTASTTSSTSSSGTDERRRSSSSDCTRAAATAATTTSEGEASHGGGGDDSNAARFHIDTKCSTEIPELKDDRYFIFNQALLVVTRDKAGAGALAAASQAPSQAQDQTQDHASQVQTAAAVVDAPPQRYSQALVCFYTSVVIYNLALAYHKRGMAGSSSSSSAATASSTTNATTTNGAATSAAAPAPAPAPISAKEARMALSQSLRLYEHCLKIVRSIANYSEDCKMLLYAVSCNLAHLYCRKGDRIRAQELLENLEDAKRFSFQNLF